METSRPRNWEFSLFCPSMFERIFFGSLKFRKSPYFQYVFVTELAVDNRKTIHEQLSKYLMTNLKPGADPVVVNDLMKVECMGLYQSRNLLHWHWFATKHSLPTLLQHCLKETSLNECLQSWLEVVQKRDWLQSKWLSKVITWLRSQRLVIGLKDSREFLNQWQAKPNPFAPCTRDFPALRASYR